MNFLRCIFLICIFSCVFSFSFIRPCSAVVYECYIQMENNPVADVTSVYGQLIYESIVLHLDEGYIERVSPPFGTYYDAGTPFVSVDLVILGWDGTSWQTAALMGINPFLSDPTPGFPTYTGSPYDQYPNGCECDLQAEGEAKLLECMPDPVRLVDEATCSYECVEVEPGTCALELSIASDFCDGTVRLVDPYTCQTECIPDETPPDTCADAYDACNSACLGKVKNFACVNDVITVPCSCYVDDQNDPTDEYDPDDPDTPSYSPPDNTPDDPGEHGEPDDPGGEPDGTEEDSALLNQIASNTNKTARNVAQVHRLLDAELNELNSNQELGHNKLDAVITGINKGNKKTDLSNSELKTIKLGVHEIKTGIDDVNTNLVNIKTEIQNQTAANQQQALDDVISYGDTLSLLESIDTSVDALQDEQITTATNQIQSFTDSSPLDESIFDSVSDSFTSLFTSGTCQDIAYDFPSINKTLTLTCDASAKIKTLLGFLCSVFTIMTLIEILFSGIVPKGTTKI